MKLDSSNSPIYLPDQEQTSVLRLGFENCAPEDWIFTANDLGVFHDHKRQLATKQLDQCYAACDQSVDAQIELHDILLTHLSSKPELGYSKTDSRLTHENENHAWEIGTKNLWQASLWVPEDFCILERVGSDYVLTAASVCSPTNWILEEKIGQTVDFIHGPVPNYDSELSARVNRFLEGLPGRRILLRYNWSIQSGNELYWRDDLNTSLSTLDSAKPNLYWRIERQTFMRLPKSNAVIFGIRIFLHSFEQLQHIDGFNQSVKTLLAQLPDEQKHYKGLAP